MARDQRLSARWWGRRCEIESRLHPGVTLKQEYLPALQMPLCNAMARHNKQPRLYMATLWCPCGASHTHPVLDKPSSHRSACPGGMEFIIPPSLDGKPQNTLAALEPTASLFNLNANLKKLRRAQITCCS